MSIHAKIKREREARGWSMEYLGQRIADVEGLSKPLSWQSIQQWEKEGGTAPKRKRMEVVAKVFDMTVAQLMGLEESVPGESPATGEPSTSYSTSAPIPLAPRSQPGIAEIILQLGRALVDVDEADREAIAALVKRVIHHPETAPIQSEKIAALIGAPGNTPVPRSSNSRS